MDVVGGRYEIEEEIGRGGMGVVLRATDTKLGRQVALKRLIQTPGLLDTDEARQRLMREARLTSQLTHPHIVALHDVVEDDGEMYLVLDYYESRSLTTHVEEAGTLGEGNARTFGTQIASALAAAHAAGIVHRDVKPDNVLVGDAGAKLTDFGVARLAETATRLTKSGFMVGTPGYMSPEQLRDEPITEAGDVFGAGLVLFYCLTGKEPFGGGPPTAIAYRVVHEPLDLSAVEAPDWMKAWITAATAKDPGDRPAASALAEALGWEDKGGGGPPLPAVGVSTSPAAPAAGAAGAPAAAAGAAGVAAGAVLGAVAAGAGAAPAGAAAGEQPDAAPTAAQQGGETAQLEAAQAGGPPAYAAQGAIGQASAAGPGTGGPAKFCASCGAAAGPSERFCGTCGQGFEGGPVAGQTPPGGPPAIVATPAGAGGGWWRERWPLVAGVAIVVLIVLIAAILVTRGAAASDEVLLEAAPSIGPDPFTEPVAAEQTPTTTQPRGTAGGGTTPSGPFGGTGDDTVCDRDLLVSFLTNPSNRAQAKAWAQVRGIAVTEISTYVADLTPTVLTADVRVTNHGFRNGKAYSRQSVLQTGTAVLVDAYGEPVVRCRCGNPLLPPRKTKRTSYVGQAWPGFNPSTVVVVSTSTQIVFPPGAQPTTTTTAPDVTTTTTTEPEIPTTGPPVGDPETLAVEMLRDAIETCVVSIGAELEPIGYDVTEGTAANVYRVRVNNEVGEEAVWSVNVATGEITPGDELAATISEECPNF